MKRFRRSTFSKLEAHFTNFVRGDRLSVASSSAPEVHHFVVVFVDANHLVCRDYDFIDQIVDEIRDAFEFLFI